MAKWPPWACDGGPDLQDPIPQQFIEKASTRSIHSSEGGQKAPLPPVPQLRLPHCVTVLGNPILHRIEHRLEPHAVPALDSAIDETRDCVRGLRVGDCIVTLNEREEISRGLRAGCSLREIARHLKRAPSSISREVRRHGGPASYRATWADWRAWQRARRPKACLLAGNERLRQLIAHKLQIDWSPQQISAWLEIAYADDETMWVSHETIYRSLFIQARGVLKRELTQHLRRPRAIRGARKRGPGSMPDGISIRERPAQVEDRAVPGHWEGDLLCGDPHSQIATLVERHSRFVMLVKTPSKDSTTVVRALAKQMRKLPVQLRRSLTWDRGFELKKHRDFTIATD